MLIIPNDDTLVCEMCGTPSYAICPHKSHIYFKSIKYSEYKKEQRIITYIIIGIIISIFILFGLSLKLII